MAGDGSGHRRDDSRCRLRAHQRCDEGWTVGAPGLSAGRPAGGGQRAGLRRVGHQCIPLRRCLHPGSQRDPGRGAGLPHRLDVGPLRPGALWPAGPRCRPLPGPPHNHSPRPHDARQSAGRGTGGAGCAEPLPGKAHKTAARFHALDAGTTRHPGADGHPSGSGRQPQGGPAPTHAGPTNANRSICCAGAYHQLSEGDSPSDGQPAPRAAPHAGSGRRVGSGYGCRGCRRGWDPDHRVNRGSAGTTGWSSRGRLGPSGCASRGYCLPGALPQPRTTHGGPATLHDGPRRLLASVAAPGTPKARDANPPHCAGRSASPAGGVGACRLAARDNRAALSPHPDGRQPRPRSPATDSTTSGG